MPVVINVNVWEHLLQDMCVGRGVKDGGVRQMRLGADALCVFVQNVFA